MAMFLNETPTNINNNPLPPSLIHSYNKKCFRDITEATEQLINKTLLPGEIAFAYYNDYNSVYGMSVIMAVGPLVHGRGNQIFKNANQIDNILTNVNIAIAEQDNIIENHIIDINKKVDDAISYVDASLLKLYDYVKDPLLEYSLNVVDINKRLNDNINYTENLTSEVNKNYIELNNLIIQLSNEIYSEIESKNKQLYNIMTDIHELHAVEINKTILSTKSSLETLISNVDTTLTTKLNETTKKHEDYEKSTTELINNTSSILTNSIKKSLDDAKKYVDSSLIASNKTIEDKISNLHDELIHNEGDLQTDLINRVKDTSKLLADNIDGVKENLDKLTSKVNTLSDEHLSFLTEAENKIDEFIENAILTYDAHEAQVEEQITKFISNLDIKYNNYNASQNEKMNLILLKLDSLTSVVNTLINQ